MMTVHPRVTSDLMSDLETAPRHKSLQDAEFPGEAGAGTADALFATRLVRLREAMQQNEELARAADDPVLTQQQLENLRSTLDRFLHRKD